MRWVSSLSDPVDALRNPTCQRASVIGVPTKVREPVLDTACLFPGLYHRILLHCRVSPQSPIAHELYDSDIVVVADFPDFQWFRFGPLTPHFLLDDVSGSEAWE